MTQTSMPSNDTNRRLIMVENRLWRHDERLSDHGSRIASLETSRDNERVRHSNTPAWLFGTIAALISVAALVTQLWIASF